MIKQEMTTELKKVENLKEALELINSLDYSNIYSVKFRLSSKSNKWLFNIKRLVK